MLPLERRGRRYRGPPRGALAWLAALALLTAACGPAPVPTDLEVIHWYGSHEAALRAAARDLSEEEPRRFLAVDRPRCPPGVKEAMQRVGARAGISYGRDPYHVHLALYYHDHLGPGAHTKGICLLEEPLPPEEGEVWETVADTDRLSETQFDVHRRISDTAYVFHRAVD